MKMKYIYLLLVSIFLSLTSCNLNQPKEELYTEIVGIEKEAMMDLVVSNYDSGQHGKSRSFSSIYHHWKNNKQNVYAGASGPVCSALVLCSHILKEMEKGKYKRVLFVPTGAVFSPTRVFQKESIPSISHAISFEVVS